MDIKIKKGDLVNLLRWSQGIAEKKTTMQILANILLEAADKRLRVTATDLEVALTAETETENKVQGRWVINARHLYEIVREAPAEEIQLLRHEANGLKVVSGKAEFRMMGMNPDDFPALPTLQGKEEVVLDPEDLSEMIDNTFYAASNDETRYILNGLLFTLVKGTGGNQLRVVATDGHRLSYSERKVDPQWNLPKGILVPRKGIQELKKLLQEGTGDLLVTSDERGIRFRRGPVTLMVRLIEGEFPSYEQVIPSKTERVVSLDRSLLAGALKRASILSSSEGRGIRMGFSPNLLEISSAHPDAGETREELPIDYRGNRFEVAFNPRYFLDLLAVLEDEKVVLELKDDVSPCVVRSEFDKGFLALVMPMRL